MFRILDFLLTFGLSEPDNNVYKQNLNCGRKLFAGHGKLYANDFFLKLENALNKVENESTVKSDWIRQGNVIFTACLVEQIEDVNNKEINKRIENVMDKLLSIISY